MTVNVKRPKTDTVERTAAFVAQQATRSLLYEVSITPKPGLVDRIDSGAHTDMDFFTYLDSSVALTFACSRTVFALEGVGIAGRTADVRSHWRGKYS